MNKMFKRIYHTVKKGRNDINVGVIFKYKGKLFTCTERKTISRGDGYGDTYDIHICKEILSEIQKYIRP
jgi:hypothetical protein